MFDVNPAYNNGRVRGEEGEEFHPARWALWREFLCFCALLIVANWRAMGCLCVSGMSASVRECEREH